MSKTAGSAVQNIFQTMPQIPNGTSGLEAYSYIYQNKTTHMYYWDAIQTLVLVGTEGTPIPPPDYGDNFVLAGIAHTHPAGSPPESEPGAAIGLYFSNTDFGWATGFTPPLGMFLGIVIDSGLMAGDDFFQLVLTPSGVDAKGNTTYKASETAPTGATTSGC
jgi:hypothetical protein